MEESDCVRQIHEEIRKIRRYKSILDNNDQWDTFHDPIEKSLIEINAFSVVLEKNKLSDIIVGKLNPVKDFQKSLEQELEGAKNDLDKLLRRIKDTREMSERLKKNGEYLQSMLGAEKQNSQIIYSKIDTIENNVKKRFMKEKKDLKLIIETLFPDNMEGQDLMARIIEHYFSEGPDKYLELEPSDNKDDQIEFLLRTELFEVNPYNPRQIKLSDLN